MVVIDHREARIYKTELKGSVPERITPFDPHGFGRYLHSVTDDSNGQRKPERKSFYEAVTKSLKGAGQIVLFGTGTGASSAMEQLIAHLKHHHADVAKRIVGSVAVDEHHLTEGQLLARAESFMVLWPNRSGLRDEAHCETGVEVNHGFCRQAIGQPSSRLEKQTNGADRRRQDGPARIRAAQRRPSVCDARGRTARD